MILVKDGIEKNIRNPKVIDRLIGSGWAKKGDSVEGDDIEALKAEATALGLEFHPRTGAAKLKALIEAAKAE